MRLEWNESLGLNGGLLAMFMKKESNGAEMPVYTKMIVSKQMVKTLTHDVTSEKCFFEEFLSCVVM